MGLRAVVNPAAGGQPGSFTTLTVSGAATIGAGLAVTGSISATGLLDISAAGAGQIEFPATQNPSADPYTLDDYEEGTWTPTLTPAAGSITTATATGTYTKIGRVVNAQISVNITDAGTGAGALQATLPFTPSAIRGSGSGCETAVSGFTLRVASFASDNNVYITEYDGTTAIATGAQITVQITYTV